MKGANYQDRRKVQDEILFKDRRLEERREGDVEVHIERRQLEKRRASRRVLTEQVRLICHNTQIECLPHDMSMGGMSLTVPSAPDLLAAYTVQINFHDRLFVNLPAKILYSQELKDKQGHRVSLQFSITTELEKNLLNTVFSELPPVVSSGGAAWDESPAERSSSISREFSESLKIEKFPLLVDGEAFDTGRYDYYPYMDKLITDRHATMRMMHQLKESQLPEDYEKYIYARYCIGNEETTERAIVAAHRASLAFRYWPLEKRRKIMEDIHALLIEKKESLIELMVIEGHPVQLVLWEFEGMEIGLRKKSLNFYQSHLDEQIDTGTQENLYLKRRADGVVCVIPPKNASCSNSLIAVLALFAGNGLILKPPLKNPISTLYLWSKVVHPALEANNAPRGILNVITGNSEKILENWMRSPLVDDILYFGESDTGIEMGAKIYRSGKKPILELSGSDLMFVWRDAPVDLAAKALLDGFLGSTQICMVPKKGLIHEDIFDAFKAEFLVKVQHLKIGLPSEPDVLLSPVTKIVKFYECLNDALAKGAKLLCGGERVNHRNIPDKSGVFITPAVLEVEEVEAALTMKCFTEENFFPLIPIIRVKGNAASQEEKDEIIFKKMISLANGHHYGLRLSAWVISKEYIEKFSEQLHNSGLLRINSRHVGFSMGLASHGGTKKSGGPFGEMNYIWQKTSHLQGISLTHLDPG